MSDQDDISLPSLQDDTATQVSGGQQNMPIIDDPIGIDQPNTERTNTNLPAEAGDLDLIEKQWVIKAKEIVAQTSENPYVQQQEIAKMKTEYIKKRYNRDMQL
jgi:hypothetical protein